MYLNKTILITGANSGLGRNLALNYARQGGRIINLSRNTETMQVLNEKLKSINKTNHLVGMFDGVLYMFLTYLIFRNRKIILSNPSLKIILLLLLMYILIYGIGVGNFGTGIRHRSKFAIIFILLAAPLLPKFIFSLKKKLKSKIK